MPCRVPPTQGATALAFFKCVAAAVVEKGLPGLVEMIPGGKFAYDVATFDEAKRAAVEAVREAVEGGGRGVRPRQAHPEFYPSQIPATVRRSLKRPDDPTGTTVPATFSLNSPDDFAELLPAYPVTGELW